MRIAQPLNMAICYWRMRFFSWHPPRQILDKSNKIFKCMRLLILHLVCVNFVKYHVTHMSLTGGKCIVICMQFSESDIEMNMNDPTCWCWRIVWKPDILYFQSSPVQLQCNRFLSGALIWASYCTKDCTYHKLSTFGLCFRLSKHILF